MAMFDLPWLVPHLNDTAIPPALERDSTATYYNNVPTVMPPASWPEPPKVGRPPRGDRAKVKAARRQRRTSN